MILSLFQEVEKLKKELKQITQNSGSNEVRLNRSIEEVEKLKASVRQAKQDEKDLRESHRKKTEELSGAVKRLDKQRIELLHAFKKQLVIIDNLKKQKVQQLYLIFLMFIQQSMCPVM